MSDMENQSENIHENTGELEFTNTPNILTLVRMVLVPVVVFFLFLNSETTDVIAMVIFVIASITDYFDGYIARANHQVTVYGKLMDPLADKFLVVSSLIMLQYLERIHPIVVILLICRELAITGLRALASAEGVVIAASASAKWKTVTQMIAIPCIMVRHGLYGIPTYWIGLGALYISLAISLWSAKDYVVDFFKGLKEKRRLKRQLKQQEKLARKLQNSQQ